MKKEKVKLNEKEQSKPVVEQASKKKAPAKKEKAAKPLEETVAAIPKTKKVKPEKKTVEAVEPKPQKSPKEDKMTKFLVSMKKSVRKSIKKEAAEAGISMNEYIVLAAVEKLKQEIN